MKMNFRREYVVIFIILVTEVLGFSLILPFLPFYAQEFGATPLIIGLIATSFSFFQFFSAPIMGRLSDHYGRKPMLILSQISTFVGFLILGFANSLWMIFLSRIVDGLLGANYTIAQAYLSDISSKKERSKVFGLSGAAFGFGFLVGPGIGGYLSQYGFAVPSFMAAGVSLVTILIVLFFLPETVKRPKGLKFNGKIFHFDDFRKFFSNPKISPKLWQWAIFIMAHVIWVSTFSLYAQGQLGFGPADVGFFLMYIGFISIIIRGGLLPKMIDRIGERRLQYIGFISIFLAMIASSVITEKWHAFIIATLFPFGSGVVRPIVLGEVSRNAGEKEQGSVMGVTNSLGSIAQIIGPIAGGFMLNYFIPGSLGILAAGVVAVGLILMMREDCGNLQTTSATV
jgi:DHA1 family tetracycline resistance protein-like MFS transporter